MKFLLLSLFLALPAKADIVFFDLNFSPMEITAVTAAAKARGEAVHIFPKRTPEQQRGLDKYYRLVHSIQGKLRNCTETPKCNELNRQYAEANERLRAIVAQVRKVQDGELERIFSELDGSSVKVSTMIFSGHSGGTGQVGGLLGWIEMPQVRQAFDRYPRLLEPVQAMLLWGCYSGTLHSLSGIWQKNFPSISTWGGFENRSPLGIRESSGRFLKSFLLAEGKLRAAKGLREAHRIFRSLDLVSELDGTAVVRDMYFTYDEAGLVSEMLQRCESFDAKIMENFLCYDEGKAGCENPPADHRGPLRDLYNFLQKNRHCRAILTQKFPEIPSLEYLIRLIYIDNVKKNFEAHHSAEENSYGQVMEAVNIKSPGLLAFGRSSRAQDVRSFTELEAGYRDAGIRDISVIDRPNWREVFLAWNVGGSLTILLGPSGYRGVDQSCVPFSWVDPGSSEKDSCRLSEQLRQPLLPVYEKEIFALWAHASIDRYLADQTMDSFWYPVPPSGEIWVKEMRGRLRELISALEKLPDRTELENLRLTLAKEKYARTESSTPAELAAAEMAGLRGLIALIEEKIEWSKGRPFGTIARDVLESRMVLVNQRITVLEQIARGW